MLKHDFVETNSDTFTLSIPFTAYSVYNFYYHIKGTDNYCWDIWVLSLCVFVAFTNEFHKVRELLLISIFSHIFKAITYSKSSSIHSIFAKLPCYPAPVPPPNSSRSSTRKLLLHHDRMARSRIRYV